MEDLHRLLSILISLSALACGQTRHDELEGPVSCELVRPSNALPPALNEASGIAVSLRHQGILWTHNDSGEPRIFAVDTAGRVRASIRVNQPMTASGLAHDWESIEVGPCNEGSCIYLGATGDNYQVRADRAILKFPEPDLETEEVEVTQLFRYRLPGRPQDIEAIFVVPGERIYLITKGRSGPITLFSLAPKPDSSVSELAEVQRLTPGLVQLPEMATGASVSPNGQIVAIRTYAGLTLYSFRDVQLSPLVRTGGISLEPLQEPQGEGVAVTDDGNVYLVSERGLDGSAAMLSRVRCHM